MSQETLEPVGISKPSPHRSKRHLLVLSTSYDRLLSRSQVPIVPMTTLSIPLSSVSAEFLFCDTREPVCVPFAPSISFIVGRCTNLLMAFGFEKVLVLCVHWAMKHGYKV